MKLKSLLAAALASTFVFSTSVFAADETTAPFSDVDVTTAQGQAIIKMYEKGYLKGYGDGTFKPSNSITRAELTRVFNQVFGYELNEETADTIINFVDNEEPEAWYYNDVRIAQSNGYIKGFEDSTFRPQANFTREQTCTVIYSAAKLEDKEIAFEISDPVSEWAKTYVNANIANEVFSLEENSTFRAKENITRAEACLALSKFINTAVSDTTTVSSDESTEETTASETETGTETTTKSSSSSSSSGGGGGGGGGSSSSSSSSSTVETTTEATTIDPADIVLGEEEVSALDRVIKQTEEEFIPRLRQADQKSIAQLILTALQSYRDDSSYDFRGDIETVKSMYNALDDDSQDNFRTVAISSYSMSDVEILMPLFEAFL